MNSPLFSVVVIARNEERTLPGLFHSLREFLSRGGEALVLDTGSDDATVGIARGLGARVEEAGAQFAGALTEADARRINERFADDDGPLVVAGERLFHFARARQHAASLAQSDFVWQLDASDEVVTLDLEAIDAALRDGRARRFEYRLRCGPTSLRVTCFYDRRLDHWEGRVHEALYENSIGTDRPPLLSLSDEQLAVRHRKDERKERSYLAGLALDAMELAANPRWTHYFGRELFYHRRLRAAIRVLEGHAALEGGWNAERAQSLCFAGECFEMLGRPDEAPRRYLDAFALDSSRREPLLKLAALAQRRDDFQAGVAFAAAALAIPRTSAFLEADENYGVLPHAFLYWGLFWLGRRTEARPHWEECRRLDPENAKFREDERFFR